MGDQNGVKKHIKSLKEAFRIICENEPQYEPLWANFISTSIDSGNRVNMSPANFPSYTCHDDNHSRAVLSKMEMLIGEMRLSSLGATDVWLLLMCAHTHDYGMLISISDIKQHIDNGKLREHYDSLKHENHGIYAEAAHSLDFNEMSTKIDELSDDLNKKTGAHNDVIHDMRNAELINALQVQRDIMLILQSYFRNSHAGGYRLSLTNRVSDGVDLRLHNLVASIDEAHTQDWSAVMELPYETDGFATDHAHPRFVAVMLRLADLLDIDASRVNPYQVRLTISGNEAMSHQERSLAVESILTNPKNIGAHFDFREAGIIKRYLEYGNGADFGVGDDNPNMAFDIITIRFNAARLAFDWYEMIKEELKNFTLNWNTIVCPGYAGSAPQMREEDFSVKINGEKITADDLDLRYELSNKRAYEIIRGAGIYNDKLAFIRELVQNAIDATKIQMFIDWENSCHSDLKRAKDITPEEFLMQLPYDIYSKAIVITVEERKRAVGSMNYVLKIDDYGTGISTEKLKKLKYVGNIYDPETERVKRLMPEWMKPTGAFGIGLQSVFQFSKRFDMKTFSVSKNESLEIMFSSTETDGIIFQQKAKGDDRRKTSGTTVIIPINDSIKSYENNECTDLFIDKTESTWCRIRKYMETIGGADIVPVILKRIVSDTHSPVDEIIFRGIFETAFPNEFEALRKTRIHSPFTKALNPENNQPPLFTFRAEKYSEYDNSDIYQSTPKRIFKYRFWYWSKKHNIMAEISFTKHVYRSNVYDLCRDHKKLIGTGDFTFRGINIGPCNPEKNHYYSWEKMHTAWCDVRFHILKGNADDILYINRDRLLEDGDKVKKIKKHAEDILLDSFAEILLLYDRESQASHNNDNFYRHVKNNPSVTFLLTLAADCLLKQTLVLTRKEKKSPHIPYIDNERKHKIEEIKESLLALSSNYTSIDAVFFDKILGNVVEKKVKDVAECLRFTEKTWFCGEGIAVIPIDTNEASADNLGKGNTLVFYPDILESYPIPLYWSELFFIRHRKMDVTLLPVYKYSVLPKKTIRLSKEDLNYLVQQSHACSMLGSEKTTEDPLIEDSSTEDQIKKNERFEMLQEFFGMRHVFPAFGNYERIAVPFDPSVCPGSLKNCGYVILSPFVDKMFVKVDGDKSEMENMITEYQKYKGTENMDTFHGYVKKLLREDKNLGEDIYGFRELIGYVHKKTDSTKGKSMLDEYVNEYMRFIQAYLSIVVSS